MRLLEGLLDLLGLLLLDGMAERLGHRGPIGGSGRRATRTGSESSAWLVALGLGVGAVGPLLAIFTLMGGDELVVPILAVASVLAGLLCAAGLRGVRGAVAVLVVPLGWALVAAWAWQSMWTGVPGEPGEQAETLQLLVAFILVQVVGIESGYVIGRAVARHRRSRRSMSGGAAGGRDPQQLFEASRSTLIARMVDEGLPPERSEQLVDAWEDEAARRGLALGSAAYWEQARAWVRAQARA